MSFSLFIYLLILDLLNSAAMNTALLVLKVLTLGCKGTLGATSVISFANRVQESKLTHYINVLYISQNSILLLLMAFSETERQFLGKDYMSISALLEDSDKLSKDLFS